ncbi:MAG: AAA family ATPase [Desulfobacterales bacterium]|jgi:type II secretory pathway predicted ATPase ExeA/cell division protein FtsB
MYLKHYNLTLKPFEIHPDQKFLWLGKKHKKALIAMKNGILEKKGFISLTGDLGTGKTTLVNALADMLGDIIFFAQVSDPTSEQPDFLNLSANASKIKKNLGTKGDFLSHLRHFLNNIYLHRKEVVLVFEEAQKFDPERLEEVRLILNLQPDKKLMSIVFVGQNEFNHILNKNKPLRQECSIIQETEPLGESETAQYILHRLKIAGSEKKIFSPEALREIYFFSEGNPRLINILCDSALSFGYTEAVKIIEPEIIREYSANRILPEQPKEDGIDDQGSSATSTQETETGMQSEPAGISFPNVAQKEHIKPAGRRLAYLIPISVVILLSIFGYLYFFGENHASYRKLKASIRTQLEQMKFSDDESAANVEALKNLKARIAELESVAAMREQMLLELTEELDREKKNGTLLSSELSTKTDLIAELQQQLENAQPKTLAVEADLEDSKIKINSLQEQLLSVKGERAAAETQLDQLRSRNAELSADNQVLKDLKKRVVALESELARNDQSHSRPDQQLSRLAKELSQEKKSRELLNSELSSKEIEIARIQEELENAQSNALEFEAEIENRIVQIRKLEGQLLNLKLEMTSPETKLGRLTSRNEKLRADIEELKGVKELVAGLENELAERDQTISSLKKRLSHIATELDQERQSRERVSSGFSKNAGLASEIQQTVQTAPSNQQGLEKTNSKGEQKIAEMQNLQGDLNTQQIPNEPSMGMDDMEKTEIEERSHPRER